VDAEVGAGEIDRQHLVPQGKVGLRHRRADGLAGVVDQDADRAQRRGGAGEGGRHRFGIGDIHALAMHLAQRAQADGLGLECCRAAAHQRHARALCYQRLGDRGADAASAAGDHGMASAQGGLR
jgi:hypothetical protein